MNHRRSKRRFRKSEQISPAEQHRQQQKMVLSRYQSAVEAVARGESLSCNLEIVLGFVGKSETDFQTDVENAQRLLATPPHLRPRGGAHGILPE